MIYSNLAMAGKILRDGLLMVRSDCLCALLTLALKYQNTLHFYAGLLIPLFFFFSLPPFPGVPREKAWVFFFFPSSAFVYLALCSGLSHYLPKCRRSLPAGS